MLSRRTFCGLTRLPTKPGLRRYSSLVSAESVFVGDTPYQHTTGKWLADNVAQHNARRITFDLQQLHDRVSHFCHGSRIKASWKQDGEFSSRLVHFLAENGKRFVAKLPLSIAGPPGLTIHSEAATIEYVRQHSDVPVPKVLEWNDSIENPVGCQYMIMEHADGVRLGSLWKDLQMSDKQKCLAAIAKHLGQLAHMQFDAYGSLYFNKASHHISPSRQLSSGDSRFCIGPYAGLRIWDPIVQPSNTDNYGPCADLVSFAHARVQAGLDSIPKDAFTRPCERSFQGSPKQHMDALAAARTVLDVLARDARVARFGAPVLTPPNLKLDDVFVDAHDPAVITAILSWRNVSIEPLFSYHRRTLLDLSGPLPDDHQASVDRTFFDNIDLGYSLVPASLSDLHDIDYNLITLFDSCHNSWYNTLPSITQALISIAGRWSGLGLSSPCPYSPPAGHHLEHHQQRVQALDDYLELADGMGVSRHDCVPHQSWSQVMALLKTALDSGYVVSDMPTDRVETLWPFDEVDLAALRSRSV